MSTWYDPCESEPSLPPSPNLIPSHYHNPFLLLISLSNPKVNNVAAVGHAHPKLAEVTHRQMHLLNTNSRFHYEAVAELSQRLSEMCPPGFDSVFLVNSGSEAVDLALRIAMVGTKRNDVVAVLEAYHGWTYLSDAVTCAFLPTQAL